MLTFIVHTTKRTLHRQAAMWSKLYHAFFALTNKKKNKKIMCAAQQETLFLKFGPPAEKVSHFSSNTLASTKGLLE